MTVGQECVGLLGVHPIRVEKQPRWSYPPVLIDKRMEEIPAPRGVGDDAVN